MIDTNILLDWLLDRDAKRTKLIDNLFATSKTLHVPDVVIVELAFALEKFYGFPRNVVSDNLHTVLDEPVLNCSRTLFQKALTEYADYSSLSFLDCCLINYAELQGAMPVWTFDKKLVNYSSGRARSLTV